MIYSATPASSTSPAVVTLPPDDSPACAIIQNNADCRIQTTEPQSLDGECSIPHSSRTVSTEEFMLQCVRDDVLRVPFAIVRC